MAFLPVDKQKRQIAFLLAFIALALAYVGYEYVYRPAAEEIAAMETRLDVLQGQNRTALALTRGQGVEGVEQQLALYRDQLGAVEGLIPTSEELPDLLDAISAEAQRTGVELALIQPVEIVDEAYYTRRVYDLAVLGGYHNIAEFLTRVASLPRIVTPINLSLEEQTRTGQTDAAPRLQAKFSIQTYVLPTTQGATDASPASAE